MQIKELNLVLWEREEVLEDHLSDENSQSVYIFHPLWKEKSSQSPKGCSVERYGDDAAEHLNDRDIFRCVRDLVAVACSI